MISMIKKQETRNKSQGTGFKIKKFLVPCILNIVPSFKILAPCTLCLIFLFSSCGVYTFKDISIDYTKVKTIKISFFENKARYVDPQFSPQLTDKLRQKITNQTRLTQVQTDDANYDVSGYVSSFDVSTSGVSNQQASTNRLTVTVHLIFKNRVDDKKSKESDISRNFDYSASLSLTDAEPTLLPTIISNMTDEIFNSIFSDW
jgi:lipopolysaccharide assembly LptE-like protein